MKRFLVPVIFIVVTACNNAGDKKETNDTTVKQTGHDSTHHTVPATGGVPELPAVPEGAKVLFGNLENNGVISSPYIMEMGTVNMKVDTAGPVVAGSGHHHLLIDGPDSVPEGVILPKDSLHIHFGKAETKYELKLAPGKHKLTLQMADGLHRSYGSKLAASITVTVKN